MCQLLAATGKSGFPDSHFHSPSISDWMGYYDLTPDSAKSERDVLSDVFKSARIRGIGNTGMFGLRLQNHSFEYFMQKLNMYLPSSSCDLERIQEVFGKTLFVHLTRQNKIEQAISYVKASQTGVWHKALNGLELEPTSVAQVPYYDAEAIKLHLHKLLAMDENWISWFAKEKLNPLRINYEDLSADPIAVIGKILDQLGLSQDLASGLEIPILKLADDTNSQWASRFREDIVG